MPIRLDARVEALERRIAPPVAPLTLLAPGGVLTPRQHEQAAAAARVGRATFVIEIVELRPVRAHWTARRRSGNVLETAIGTA